MRRRPILRSGAVTSQQARQPQGQQRYQGRAPTEVLAILPVQAARVADGLLRARVPLGPSSPATAAALPPHGGAISNEAGAVAEELAAQHDRRLAGQR
jgi:hypothetical protein